MKKEKSYSFPLYDTSEDKTVGILSVTTTKTVKEFKNDYLAIRSNWYEEDFPNSLDNYLVENLESLGYSVSIEIFNGSTDYLEF